MATHQAGRAARTTLVCTPGGPATTLRAAVACVLGARVSEAVVPLEVPLPESASLPEGGCIVGYACVRECMRVCVCACVCVHLCSLCVYVSYVTYDMCVHILHMCVCNPRTTLWACMGIKAERWLHTLQPQCLCCQPSRQAYGVIVQCLSPILYGPSVWLPPLRSPHLPLAPKPSGAHVRACLHLLAGS